MTEIQALLLIKSILESADIHGIESFLAEDCEYMSTGRGIIGRNRNETIEFLSSMAESIKADNVPVTCKVSILPMCTRRMRYSMRVVMV